jgi:hypothetical protein
MRKVSTETDMQIVDRGRAFMKEILHLILHKKIDNVTGR